MGTISSYHVPTRAKTLAPRCLPPGPFSVYLRRPNTGLVWFFQNKPSFTPNYINPIHISGIILSLIGSVAVATSTWWRRDVHTTMCARAQVQTGKPQDALRQNPRFLGGRHDWKKPNDPPLTLPIISQDWCGCGKINSPLQPSIEILAIIILYSHP